MQACRRVVVEPSREAVGDQRLSLIELEAQLRRADYPALSIVDEVVYGQPRLWPGGHHHTQVRRRVAHQVGEQHGGAGRQVVGPVDEQRGFHGLLGDLRQQANGGIQPIAGWRVEQCAGQLGAPPGVPQRKRQGLHQAHGIILRLRGQPGDHEALGKVFEAPLRQ